LKKLIKHTNQKRHEPIYTVLSFVILCKIYFSLIPGLQNSSTYPYLKTDESSLRSTHWFFNSRYNMHPCHVLIHCHFKIYFGITISAKSSFFQVFGLLFYMYLSLCNVFYLIYRAYLRIFIHHDNIWRRL